RLRSYDPATGKLIWEIAGMRGQCYASPVGDEAMLYVGIGGGGPGRGGPLYGIKAGASGALSLPGNQTSNAGLAWGAERGGPSMASPLLYRGYLYILSQGGGLLSCYDAKTGKEAYRERIPGASGFTASPWAYDGKVFCLDENGQTFVLQPGPQLKVLEKNSL